MAPWRVFEYCWVCCSRQNNIFLGCWVDHLSWEKAYREVRGSVPPAERQRGSEEVYWLFPLAAEFRFLIRERQRWSV